MKDDLLKALNSALTHNMSMGRDDDNDIHVSDIFDFCSRRYVLSKEHDLLYNPPTRIGPSLALTFKIGLKIGDIITESVKRKYPSFIMNDYVCSKCERRVPQQVKPYLRAKCAKCGGIMYPEEVLLKYNINDKYSLCGNIDMCFGADKFYPIEIKSIKPEEFDELKEPQVKHLYQITGYMWMIKKLKLDKFVKDKGVVLYVSKGHKPSPLKIFEVSPLKEANRRINEIKNELTTEGMPNRICRTKRDLLAKTCPRCSLCFKTD